MKKIVSIILFASAVGVLAQAPGFTRSGTNLLKPQFVMPGHHLLIDRGGGLPPASVALSNLFSVSNQTIYVGDYFTMSSGEGNWAQMGLVKNHGTGHGYVFLGGLSGDVVLTPTYYDGVLQFGATANAGSYHYLQYATSPDAANPVGFSHPLEFRANTTNGLKLPGIVGFGYAADGSSLGELRFYAKSPHWGLGNKNPESPTIAGTEIFRANTNGLVLADGRKIVGDGSGLTNIAAGGTGLSLDALMPGNMVATFTSGSLSAYQAIDSTAQTFFSRAGVTNATEVAAINRFIRTMKASATTFNITNWDAAYFYPLATNFGYNALSTSYDTTWSGSPSQSGQQGVNFDGVDDYGNTGINFRSGTTVGKTNQYSIVAYLSADTLDNLDVLVGAQDGSSALLLRKYVSGGSYAEHLAEFSSAITLPPSIGALWFATRSGTSSKAIDVSGYANTNTTAMTTFPNANFWVGARDNGGAANFMNGRLRLVLIGGYLDAAGVAECKSAVAQFWTDLRITL